MATGQGDSWSHCFSVRMQREMNVSAQLFFFSMEPQPAKCPPNWGGLTYWRASSQTVPELCVSEVVKVTINIHCPPPKDAASGPMSLLDVSLYFMSPLFWLQSVLILRLHHVLRLGSIWGFSYIMRFSKGLATGEDTKRLHIYFFLRSIITLHNFSLSLWPQVGTWLDFSATTWLLWSSSAQVPCVSIP